MINLGDSCTKTQMHNCIHSFGGNRIISYGWNVFWFSLQCPPACLPGPSVIYRATWSLNMGFTCNPRGFTWEFPPLNIEHVLDMMQHVTTGCIMLLHMSTWEIHMVLLWRYGNYFSISQWGSTNILKSWNQNVSLDCELLYKFRGENGQVHS